MAVGSVSIVKSQRLSKIGFSFFKCKYVLLVLSFTIYLLLNLLWLEFGWDCYSQCNEKNRKIFFSLLAVKKTLRTFGHGEARLGQTQVDAKK